MIRYSCTVFLLCAAFALQAQSAADEIRINEVFQRTPLSRVLKIFQEKYNARIAFDHSLVQNIVISLQLSDRTLYQSLELVLAETSLTFQRVGDNIVIFPRPPALVKITSEKINIRLSGNVVDDNSNETLPQATIQVRGTAIAATTNTDGYFTIFDIPHDTCTLMIRYLGYITQIIRAKDIETDHLTIRLKSDTRMLHEVVVLDEYNQPVRVEDESGTTVFNPASLSTLPSLGEQDISRTLHLLPGVTATDESSSGMTIRGSHSSYNLTLLDGMTIYQQDHFFGAFSIINADIIKDVRVHKGMFDAKYGGRVSGVIDMTSKNGNSLKPAVNVKLNLMNAKATVEMPIGKKWSLFAGARRSYTDAVQSSLFTSLFDIARTSNDQIEIFRYIESVTGMVRPKYYFFDINSKLTFRPTQRDILSLSLYASRDKLNLTDKISFIDSSTTFILGSEEATRWGNNGLSLRWARQWNEHYYSTVRLSDSKFFRRYHYYQQAVLDTTSSAYQFNFENSISDLTYAFDNEWNVNDKLSFQWGLQGVRQETDLHMQDQYTIDPPPDDIPADTVVTDNKKSWQHSLYGTLIISPVNRLSLSIGARLVHYHNQQAQLHVEPRLHANYKVTNQLNLKSAYARSNQFITQLFYYSPTGSISGITENFWMLSQPGEPRYPVITSDHISAGATLRQQQIVYDAEVYYKFSRGIIIDEDLHSGSSNIYGLDLMVQKISGVHRGWIAYSLSRANQEHPDILQGRAVPSWQDQRHELKVVNMLILGNWNLSSTLIFGSGKPYAKYNVEYYRDNSDMILDYDLVLDYSNRSRLPSYFSMNLAASYTILFKHSQKMEFALSLHNVTDHKNIKTRSIDTEWLNTALFTSEELPARYKDVVLLGFSPALSIHFYF